MKVALVTGAAKRIGKAIADRLLYEGFHVLLHANNSVADLEAWVGAHQLKNQVIGVIKADLSTASGQDALVLQAKNNLNALDLLVHNASTFYPQAFSDISRKSYQDMLAVNLEAPFFVTQGLLHLLLKAKSPSVINIIDAMWKRPSPKYSHYAVSKAGLAILTRSLANELAPRVRVNAVAPGSIMFQPFHSEEVRERIIERIPHKRLGEPTDVAEAVVFLSRALYTAGEILVIDGGRSIAP